MARLPTRRSRLITVGWGIIAVTLQAVAGIMSVPGDLAPPGTFIGFLVSQERTLIPWLVMGVNTIVLFLLIKSKKVALRLLAIGLSGVHGLSYMIGFYYLNLYPSLDLYAIPFFAGLYWVGVGVVGAVFYAGKLFAMRLGVGR
jgi:TctA family transporter